MKIKLTVAYDGAPYKGWAKQPGLDTIQGILECAIASVVKSPISLYGSGRTDTGVHAHAQVAHFEIPEGCKIPLKAWPLAINSRLPPQIRVMNCEQVSDDFHARFSAISKTYCYTIITTPILSPHLVGRAWHIPRTLDLQTLRCFLDRYVGSHDFRNFSALRGNESKDTSYIRVVTQAQLSERPDGIQIRYSANGFLYKMVRILTGVAVNAAQGGVLESEFDAMLTEPLKKTSSKYCAPASGLTLEKVSYS